MSFSYGTQDATISVVAHPVLRLRAVTSGQPASDETVAPEPADDLFGLEDAPWEYDDQPAPAAAPLSNGIPALTLPTETYSVLPSWQPAFEETVAPEPADEDEDAEWEADDQRATAVTPPRKNRSGKPLTPAQVERNRQRVLDLAKTARHKADTRLPNVIYGTVSLVTEKSHPRTEMVEFQDPGLPMDADYMSVRGFRNCLEHHIERLSPGKQRSFHRPADTLRRIVEKNPTPPMHYPRDDATTCANWRHEIGVTITGNPLKSNSWDVWADGSVHRVSMKAQAGTTVKSRIVEILPEEPTEEWYAILTKHHHTHGHCGRDAVFKRISENTTTSISKDLVSDFVFQCCDVGLAARRKHYQDQAVAAKQKLASEGRSPRGKKRGAMDSGGSISPPPAAPVAKRPRIASNGIRRQNNSAVGGPSNSQAQLGTPSETASDSSHTVDADEGLDNLFGDGNFDFPALPVGRYPPPLTETQALASASTARSSPETLTAEEDLVNPPADPHFTSPEQQGLTAEYAGDGSWMNGPEENFGQQQEIDMDYEVGAFLESLPEFGNGTGRPEVAANFKPGTDYERIIWY